MKAMIFAAGLGTRLKPLTDTMPKAMVPVAGKPLVQHVIERLQKAGYDEFVVNAHHFASQITDFLAANANFGSQLSISLEQDEPLETGGGIKAAGKYLQGCGSFLVHNVDILSNVDFEQFRAAVRSDALATLLVSQRKTSRYLLFNDDMRLVGWTNVATGEVRSPFTDLKPQDCHMYAFSGIHILSEKVLSLMEDWPEKFPIMDFYLKIAAQQPIYGVLNEGLEMIDVGKLDSLEKAEQFVQNYSSTR